MSVRGDGRDHISGRFYVDGVDETGAPELAGLGRRRLVVVVVSAAVLFGVGLLWTREPVMAFVVVLACAFQGAFLIWFVTERLTIGAIHKRHLADPTLLYRPQTVQEDAVAYLVSVSDARQGWAKGLGAAAILAGLFAFDHGGWWWAGVGALVVAAFVCAHAAGNALERARRYAGWRDAKPLH